MCRYVSEQALMKMKRYYIYCDESIKKGNFYSNFYGGALIDSEDYGLVKEVLESKREHLIKTSELKWQKINHHNYKSYIDAIDTFFDFIQANTIKIRIMFTDNRFIKPDLKNEHFDNEFLLLYYQFLKHTFGLKYLSSREENHLEIFLDMIPDKEEKKQKFINYIFGIQYLPDFIEANIKIRTQQISEVDSKNHIIMQYLDVVLGAVATKLNKMNLVKHVDTGKRGKRTIAKEKVYKHINKRIRQIYPNFNIGISTGLKDSMENLLLMQYRHWSFKGKNSVLK